MNTATQAIPESKERWSQGLSHEMGFWRDWIRTRGLEWKDDFNRALTPGRPLEQVFINHLKSPPGSRVEILDVGSGPLPTLGGVKWEGREVVVTAVDPLADEYNRALDEAGVTPLLRVRKGEAESLMAAFGPAKFDLVYAANCIDHSYDPVHSIREMVGVVKPGCYVMLEHAVNEGENMRYEGLHQWNFGVDEGGAFSVWRPGWRTNIEEALEGEARVSSTLYERANGKWLSVRIRKFPRGGSRVS